MMGLLILATYDSHSLCSCSLEELHLSCNDYADVELSDLSHSCVQRLHFNNNLVTSWHTLEKLGVAFPQLKMVMVRANPLNIQDAASGGKCVCVCMFVVPFLFFFESLKCNENAPSAGTERLGRTGKCHSDLWDAIISPSKTAGLVILVSQRLAQFMISHTALLCGPA